MLAAVAIKNRERMGEFLPHFSSSLDQLYVIWENVQTRELGKFNAYWLLFASSYQFRLTSKQFSQYSTMQRVNFQLAEIVDSLSLLSQQYDGAQQLQSEEMWYRQYRCSSITGFLVTKKKKKKRPCAMYLQPWALLWSQDVLSIMWSDFIMPYSLTV